MPKPPRTEHPTPPDASPPGTGNEAEDLRLAGLAASGDREALAQLYERHKDRVFGVALRVLRDAAEAADVLQDTFLVLLGNARARHLDVSAVGWLLRVAGNLSIDRLRRRRVRGLAPDERSEPVERLDPGAPPDERAATAERDAEVQRAMEALSPKLRLVVALRYAAGCSYEQIAEALDCSIGTVKSRLARAHARLEGPLAEIRRRHGEG